MADRAKNSREFRHRRRLERYGGVDPIAGGKDDRHLWSLKTGADISHLTTIDLAYFAGIVDGEGSISCMAPGITSHYEISIGTTSPELLDWLRIKLPFGHLVTRKPVMNLAGTGFRKQQYEWKIRGALTVLNVLEVLIPYLTIKLERAIEVYAILLQLYEPYRHLTTLPHLRRLAQKPG